MPQHMLHKQEAALGTDADVLRIQNAAASLDPDVSDSVHELVRVLDQSSTLLAADKRARYAISPLFRPVV